ncbi:hypothetical protein D3C76_1755900 [compost metagenome]
MTRLEMNHFLVIQMLPTQRERYEADHIGQITLADTDHIEQTIINGCTWSQLLKSPDRIGIGDEE